MTATQPPTRQEIARICRVLTLGGTARCAGQDVTIDGYGGTLSVSRAAYEAALSAMSIQPQRSTQP